MPRMLALRTVQRQTAASRSAKPAMREQHGFTGGFPNVRSTSLSTLAQTPSCRESLGQEPVLGVLGVLGVVGVVGVVGVAGVGMHL